MTDKQEKVLTIVNQYGCTTTTDIARLIKRIYNETISSNSIAGTLRPFIARGMAANADNGQGKKVYWLTEYGKEKLQNELS